MTTTCLFDYNKEKRSFTITRGRQGHGKVLMSEHVRTLTDKTFLQENNLINLLLQWAIDNKLHLYDSAEMQWLHKAIKAENEKALCIVYYPDHRRIEAYPGTKKLKENWSDHLFSADFQGRIATTLKYKQITLIEGEKAFLQMIKQWALDHGCKLHLHGSVTWLIGQIQKAEKPTDPFPDNINELFTTTEKVNETRLVENSLPVHLL